LPFSYPTSPPPLFLLPLVLTRKIRLSHSALWALAFSLLCARVSSPVPVPPFFWLLRLPRWSLPPRRYVFLSLRFSCPFFGRPPPPPPPPPHPPPRFPPLLTVDSAIALPTFSPVPSFQCPVVWQQFESFPTSALS